MTGKPSLAPVPDNTLGRPRHPLRMPGYLQDRITLAILGMAVAIVSLVVMNIVLGFAFVAAKYQELPPIQGAIMMPNGAILNQNLLTEKDAVDAGMRETVRQHVYRWRSVTNNLTVEQQWKGMEFRVHGAAADQLFGGMKDPARQPGTVLVQGMVRCTDVPPLIVAYPSTAKPGWYEANWYEKVIRSGERCDPGVLRQPANLRWAEFQIEIDAKPSAEKKLWNPMGFTITDYRSDVID